jgi:hypothetical protein
MPIPSINELMRPVLDAHLDRDRLQSEDLVEALAPSFSLSSEELEERQPSGDLVFLQRINWARTFLAQLGYLAKPQHGITEITASGREALADGREILPPPSDWSQKPVSRESVLAAMGEFDREGRNETLQRHGYRRALDYMVAVDGKEYDSKALYGIAYGIEYPDEEPIRNRGFQGGDPVVKRLEALGFSVESRKTSVDGSESTRDRAALLDEAAAWLRSQGNRPSHNRDIARAIGITSEQGFDRVYGWMKGDERFVHQPEGKRAYFALVATATKRRSWIFQANPKIYDVQAALEVLATLQWVTRHSFREIHAGDEVYIWQAGPSAGIIATVRVLTEPTVEPASSHEPAFLTNAALSQAERRVWLAVERVFATPVLKVELLEHPVLATLGPIQFANATNFAVKPDQEAPLREFLQGRPSREVSPEKLFFFTAAGALAAEHLRLSLREGVALETFAGLSDIYTRLQRHARNGRVFAWGARPGQAAEKKWERLNPGDVALIYFDGRFPMWGRVYAKARSKAVAEKLWGENDGETWDCMYFLDPVGELSASRETVLEALGYSLNYTPQGFEIPSEEVQTRLKAEYAALPRFIDVLGTNSSAPARRVWWVNQGSTYSRSRDLGCLWAPQLNKAGRPEAPWTLLNDARSGDLVLHYSSGSIRAVGTVTAQAIDAAKPEGFGDPDEWSEDGWLLGVEYRELAEPVALATIPGDWRTPEAGPFTAQGAVQQVYFSKLSSDFVKDLAHLRPDLGLIDGIEGPMVPDYEPPSFEAIAQAIGESGLRLSEQTIRRYHLSLQTRGFVVLSGLSGSGKTWLATRYGEVVGAETLLVAVAPNWTTNEDLLGYFDPLAKTYRHTSFSQFLIAAAKEYQDAQAQGRTARPFHLILDEMNLARVEYYFAKFLSAMEVRARNGTAELDLSETEKALLTPNLKFIGTVNVDETTHGFADKVYDRAQLIEIPVERDEILAHLAGRPYRDAVMSVWDIMLPVAPFAYRVLDEISGYLDAAIALERPWQEALDEQLLQKVLPKIKGTDLDVGSALQAFVTLAQNQWPLSGAKAGEMLTKFTSHGFTSYFS